MLSAQNLHFAYHTGPEVIRGLSCDLAAGEIVGIIGPNGSGKTTLLHLLAGLLHPAMGTISVSNDDIQSLSRREIAQRMALVAQRDEIHLPFPVWDVVLMGRSAHQRFFSFDSATDRTIAERALQATASTDLKDRPITELSGGERRRVLIARALTQQTPILILDEPTSQLDIRYQLEICELLRRLCDEEERSIIVTLHDMNLAALYCDRIIMLDQGRTAASGTAREVLTQEMIARVYGVEVAVEQDAQSGRPQLRLQRKVPRG